MTDSMQPSEPPPPEPNVMSLRFVGGCDWGTKTELAAGPVRRLASGGLAARLS